MNLRSVLSVVCLAVTFAACSTTNPNTSGSDRVAEKASIDANVKGAMSKLNAQAPGSRELVRKAKGVLVFPSVVSAGFIVGGSYGRGELLVGGRTTGYYSTTAASVGLLAGADSKAVYVLFMTQDALDRFLASNGWTAGVDASVSVLKAGADANIDTRTAEQPVLGYVLTNAGLMANLSIDGTKVDKLDL